MLPRLLAYQPDFVWPGYGAFTLRVEGRYFYPTSVVRIDGTDYLTRFISDSVLEVDIPATFTATHGDHSIVVHTPPPGGGTSGTLDLPVENPRPAIDSVTPDSVGRATGDIALTVYGNGFFPGSQIDLNYMTALSEEFISTRQLRATLPSDGLQPGEYWLRVLNDWPGGGSAAPRLVVITNPVPRLDSLRPDSVPSGTTSTVSAFGANFFPGATYVLVDGNAVTRNVLSANRVDFTVISSTASQPVILQIEIRNDGPGGGISGALGLRTY